ncbi:MAG TPA: 30S ribosomal protein S1 [Fimbriimonadales bacterium]|nr:30S ribosomal protein S1 [Fimbriimonadales bacterium]
MTDETTMMPSHQPENDVQAIEGSNESKKNESNTNQNDENSEKFERKNGYDEFSAAMEEFASEGIDEVPQPLTKGEVVTATVVQVDKDRVFVDLGQKRQKAEGVIPLAELSQKAIDSASDVVKVGDRIKVKVIRPDSREGNPIVSKRLADFEAAWERLVEDYKSGRIINAMVINRVRGGLEVDVGVRGFVPASHVATSDIKKLDRYVGQSIPLKIIDIDSVRNKVVLSNKEAEEILREQRRKEFFANVRNGDILKGKVRRLVDYGAFVDLNGVDGLLHVSEISWARLEHPREELKVGDEVTVMVLRVDPERGRVSLGRRHVLPDPWVSIKENYHIGQQLKTKISRVVQSGAFVRLPEGAEAFIPVSEMAHRRISRPSDIVKPGDEVDVQVIELRPEERRMVLSMKALLPYEERQPRREPKRKGRQRRITRTEEEPHSTGTTIGERLGALRGLIQRDEEQSDESVETEQSESSVAAVDLEASEEQEHPERREAENAD